MKWILTMGIVFVTMTWSADALAEVYSVGHSETIHIGSKQYGVDVFQPIVDIIATLPHGREMGKLSVFVASPEEVTEICGRGGDACYMDAKDRMVIPPELTDGSTMPETIAHEYGHHLANSRPGGAFGTPRWDIYEHVCELLQRGKLDTGRDYTRNPEESFAQSYASLAVPELAEEEWWFSDWLEPTGLAPARIQLDIEQPWPRRYAEARLRRSCHGGRDYYDYYY